jgi:ATP-binding cassette subfamily C (CFTR/MRP) protein 1
MLDNIINAPINLYHDVTPFGQIMNKFTMDLDKCVLFFRHFSSTLNCFCTLVGAIIVCVNSNKYMLLFIPVISYFGYKISVFYAPAGRDILRIESINRTPLISYYSETIQGIDTIKSLSYHNVEQIYFSEFSDRILQNLSVLLFKFGARAFFELTLDLLSVFFVCFVFIYCIIFHEKFTAVIISLLLKYSMSLSDEILSMLTHGTELENSFVRIERCESCFNLPKEQYEGVINITDKNDFEGRIKFDKIFIKYRPNLDYVLKDISINIEKKEKICIMGRTGSGKSTIILGLFRLVEADKGGIFINNLDIQKIPLKELRRNLGIVPQEPKIFSGTLKFNLDPLNNYTDYEINNAINEVGLFKLMEENGRDISQKFDLELKENGGNLSLGEKQLICLARIFLRKNKIVIMDEATSNIDNKTDIIIQNAVDKIFKDSTLIIIAHKIPDLNKYDKIMVLDDGELIEFDTPNNLLKNNNGIFRQLYDYNINIS